MKTSNNSDVMVEKGKLKITVLKKTDTKQIFGDKPPMGQAIEACNMFEEGQEFIVDENGDMPKGFCHWAWNDLYKVVTTLMYGGNHPWMKEKGTSVSCCTDGLRPVIFELRRIVQKQRV
jgi:uncharacterized repeat protein (TIGR04076 family)